MKELKVELKNLKEISLVTYNLCLFVYDNMDIIKSILEFFDSHFENYFGLITKKYLKQRIQTENTDINYIVKFKVKFSNKFLNTIKQLI